MTNDPASIAAALRTFAVYAVCSVLAIILGVLMTNPMTYSSLGFVAILGAFLLLPILLRWHHPFMIFAWNTPIILFFVKTSPKLSMAMIAISLTVSIVESTVSQRRFINVPQITWPLLFMAAVVFATAKLTGGFGLRALGSDVYGGKKYIFLLLGIVGYFAMTARPIPPEKAQRYVAFFFLGAALGFVGDFYSILPHFLAPLFWLIPPEETIEPGQLALGTTRLSGTSWAATAMVSYLIARYGLRGILITDKLWRPVALLICFFLIFFGGFRSALIITGLTVTMQFFLEGLHRSKLMPFFVIFFLGTVVAVIPLAGKLPFTFQRTLAFLPESYIHLRTDARMEAQASTDWRLQMWQGLLPQIPKHLLLGKGYAISMEDFANMGMDSPFQSNDPSQQGLALSGDYHSGPLSVIIPFGIWGVIAFLWFIIAGLRVIYLNYRYGEARLKTINTFLFTTYTVGFFGFIFIYGDFSGGMLGFGGYVGLSVALNRGVCRAPKDPARNILFKRPLANARSRPQPAFQQTLTPPRPL